MQSCNTVSPGTDGRVNRHEFYTIGFALTAVFRIFADVINVSNVEVPKQTLMLEKVLTKSVLILRVLFYYEA